MTEHHTCPRGDRDVPGIVCGYPLPCPYHTVTIDLEPTPPTVAVPVTARVGPWQRGLLRGIAKGLAAGLLEDQADE